MKASIVLKKIKDRIKSTLPDGGKAILYGSRARGEAHFGSDWDILVILDKPRLEMADYLNISYPLTTLGCDLGEEINPLLYTKADWESYSITPFYKNVTLDGITL